MELIIFIAFIVYVIKAAKQADENQKRQDRANKNPWEGVAYQAPKQAMRMNSPKVQLQQQTKEEIQAQIARTKQRILESRGLQNSAMEYFKPVEENQQQENHKAMQQVYQSRVEARTTSILERAKGNTDEDKKDVTLETMEAEHNHSERVSAAVHHYPEDVILESNLGTIEDLIAKGYDGNLCFERDFVGEGLDMISRFTVPSDVPDFS